MTSKVLFNILIISFFSISSIAQIDVIPFQLAGKLIVIKAMVGGQEGYFIVDSGIDHMVLNSNYYDGEKQDRIYHGLNGQTGKIKTNYFDAQIGTNTWKNVYAEIISLTHLESIKYRAIHGMIGSKMLRKYALQIDYRASNILLYKLGRDGGNPAILQLDPPSVSLPFRYKGSTPFITVSFANTSMNLAIDTGAEINLFHEKCRKSLQANVKQVKQKRLSSFSKKSKQVTACKLTKVKFGIATLKPMNTLILPLTDWNKATSGPKMDGIVGFEFLVQFRTLINFRTKEIHFWPIEKKTAGGHVAMN